MHKINFSEHVMSAFEKNNCTYEEYKASLLAVANREIMFDEEGNKLTDREVNDRIRKVQFAVVGTVERRGKRIQRPVERIDIHTERLFHLRLCLAVRPVCHHGKAQQGGKRRGKVVFPVFRHKPLEEREGEIRHCCPECLGDLPGFGRLTFISLR